MKDHIRESIGDLITDEDLSKIIHRGVEDVFLKPTTEVSGIRTIHKPALVHSIVKELLEEQVYKAVDQWIKDNPDVVKEALENVINLGVGNAVVNAFNSQFQSQLYNFQSNIEQTLLNR